MSLSQVPILEADNWAEFNRRANEWLVLAGYDDLLDGTAPSQDEEEANTDFQKRVRLYNQRMKRACTAIRNRCGVNAHSMVENNDDLPLVMDILGENFPGTRNRHVDRPNPEILAPSSPGLQGNH